MLYVSRGFKKAIEDEATPPLTKLVLISCGEGDTLAAEDQIKQALVILRESNSELFPSHKQDPIMLT